MKEYSKKIMKKIMNNISHIADILAIPFFALAVIYFYNINKYSNEMILSNAFVKSIGQISPVIVV